jgi:hypothetical protein
MLAVVCTAPKNIEARRAVRNNWRFPENVAGKFILCNEPSQPGLEDEDKQFKDMMFLDCSEGYLEGKLTKKVLAAMDAYVGSYPDTKYFFKLDDDSLPDIQTVLDVLHDKGDYVYAGVMYEDPKSPFCVSMKRYGACMPIKDPKSPWYEPDYSSPYPKSASGGAGYVLSKPLVNQIVRIDRKATENNMLWNEDKAVGVWVKHATQKQQVEYVDLPGTDGYGICEGEWARNGKWLNKSIDFLRKKEENETGWESIWAPIYSKLTLRHHLKPDSMWCLVHEADSVRRCVCGA